MERINKPSLVTEPMQPHRILSVTIDQDGYWRVTMPGRDLDLSGRTILERRGVSMRLMLVEQDCELWVQGQRVLSCRLPQPRERWGLLAQASPLAYVRFPDARIDGFNVDLRPPFLSALIDQDVAAIKQAITDGIDPSAPLVESMTPLVATIFAGKTTSLSTLLGLGVSLDQRSDQGGHAALIAAVNGPSPEILRSLVDAGLNIRQELECHPPTRDFWVRHLDEQTLTTAIDLGLFENLDSDEAQAWTEALARRSAPLAMVETLVDHGVDLDWYGLIATGDLEGLQRLHQATPGLVKTTIHEATPLHYAVSWQQHAILKWLVEIGADINAQTLDRDETALHWVTLKGPARQE